MTNGNFPQGQPYGHSNEQPAHPGHIYSPQDVLATVFGHAVGADPDAPYTKRKPQFLPDDYGSIPPTPGFTDMREQIDRQYEGAGQNVGDNLEVEPQNVDPARMALLGLRRARIERKLAKAGRRLETAEGTADQAVVIARSVIDRSGDSVVPGVSTKEAVALRNRLEVLRGKVAHHETDDFYKKRDAGLDTSHSHKTKHHRKFVRKATEPIRARDRSRRKVEKVLHKRARIIRAQQIQEQRRADPTS